MPKGRTLRTSWMVAALVLMIAAETRFLGLGIRSLWFDEAFSVNVARYPVAAIVHFLPGNDSHPPLYYVLLAAWIHLFGSSESAVRSLSALASFAAVPLLYAFARPIAGGEVALMAAALLAGSAFAAVAGQEARMYPLLGLFALISWFSLRLALQQRKLWPWIVYAMSSAAMLYTHYFGFLVLGSQVLYLLPLLGRDRRMLGPAALAFAAVALLFVPWLPSFLVQAASGRVDPTFRPPVDLRGIVELLGLYGFGGELVGMGGYHHAGALPLWQEGLIVLPLVCLVAAGAYALRGERAWCLLCYWAVPVALALILSLRHNVFYSRYFSFLAPPFALLVAAGIDAVVGFVPRWGPALPHTRSAVVAGAVAVIVLVNAPVLNGYRWHRAGDYNWRGAAAVVSRAAGPNDYLVFTPGFGRIPFEYYYKGHLGRYDVTPTEVYESVRMQTPTTKLDRAWVRSIAEAHPRIWIVATVPMTQDSYLRLQDLLKESFTPALGWDFNNVYVYSLTSRLYGGKARAP